MAEKQTRKSAVVYQFGELPGVLQIESTDALRALGHPVRAAILKELGKPRSVKEVADELGIPVARLYHHVKTLLSHQIIVETGQRKAGSNTERIYQVAAGRIEVSGELTHPWREAADDIGTMVEGSGRRFADAFRLQEASREHDPVAPWFVEAIGHLEPDEAAELVERLREVTDDISRRARRAVPGSKTPPRPRLGISIAVVPFPPSRERRYVEMRADPPDAPAS
jgi:DNA-binding transcriptional ArsR family regulator